MKTIITLDSIVFIWFVASVKSECTVLSNGNNLYCEYGAGTLVMTPEYPNVTSIEFVNMFVGENCEKHPIPKMVKKIKSSPVQFCGCLCYTSEKYVLLLMVWNKIIFYTYSTTSNCGEIGNLTKCTNVKEVKTRCVK